jgi:L-ascorbate metabolism protein UlaG (beta-lactamase superfamily)
MSWYWLIVVVAVLVVLYPFQGWITWLVHQRRRERRFAVVSAPRRPMPEEWRDDRVTIAWLGHATLLINFYGKHVLTDPVFGESVGLHLPFGISFGPRRLVRCALRPEELPALDLVVQSHAHMDHLDTRSWKRLRPVAPGKALPHSPAVVMAAHNARYIRRFGFEPVTELDWGESVEAAGIRVTAIEVKHWGERLPWSRNHGYNAYLLERHGATILFGGDTAYTETFRQACAGKKIDVAVLPIGGYQPYIRAHASPEQAWQMFREIGAEYLIPIHHQTFILSYEPPDEPLERLLAAAGKQAHRIVIRQVGETFELNRPPPG